MPGGMRIGGGCAVAAVPGPGLPESRVKLADHDRLLEGVLLVFYGPTEGADAPGRQRDLAPRV